jgi:hypothetical protein
VELKGHFGAAGFLGIAELTNTLEWLHPMELGNSGAILFHPRDFGPGGSHGAVGRSGTTSRADEVEGWRGMGGGNAYSRKDTCQTNLDESPQHLARPLSTGGHTTLPPCGVPTNFVQTIAIPLTSESWWQL